MSEKSSLGPFLSGEQAGPHFRWGTTATLVTSFLSILLLISLFLPDLSGKILSFILQVSGALALIAWIILSTPPLRYGLLGLLLKWRGWAYIPRSGIARLYLGTIGILGGRKPKLWQLQPTLPSLPVPPLQQTCQKYLESVKPILTPEEFEKTVQVVKEFQKPGGVGEQLQNKLIERTKTVKTSWLIEWWEKYVYYSSRYPLTIYSNWYGLDRIDPLLRSQTARSANLISGLLKFKKLVDSQLLEPNRVQDTAPLCMWQYSRIFGSNRIPGVECDELQQYSSQHIIVIYKDFYFKVQLFDKKDPLSPREIQAQLNYIIEEVDKMEPSQPEEVAALTSEERSQWAKWRKELIQMDEKNKETIEAIETALFVLILDEESPETVEEMATLAMHRKGKSIWYDKNFNMIVFKNGRQVCNVDHSWADASIMVHVYDFVYSVESSVDYWVRNESQIQLKPQKLEWQLTPEASKAVAEAKQKLVYLSNSCEIHVLKFQTFGKGLIKKLGMSPDAFCQMAIQLAYYRIHKEFTLTYESAATVRFKFGRTETVRSCSNLSKRFVEVFEDEKAQPKEKTEALRAAVKYHVKLMRAATNGDGIDRHLFGLRVSAMESGMKLPEIFNDKAYQLKFKLSTSQTPATGMLGGGFAPIAEDGYGVSYVVAEDRIWFHITAYTPCEKTSSVNFGEHVRKALVDMHDICFEDPNVQNVLSKRIYRIQRAE